MIGQAFRKFKFSYLLCVMRSSEQCEGVLAVVQHRLKGKDKLFGDVTILFEVKKPEESKYPYDYYRLVSTIPADQAFRPIEDGGCPMIK